MAGTRCAFFGLNFLFLWEGWVEFTSSYTRARGENPFVGKGHKKTCHVPGSRVVQVVWSRKHPLSHCHSFIEDSNFNFVPKTVVGWKPRHFRPSYGRERLWIKESILSPTSQVWGGVAWLPSQIAGLALTSDFFPNLTITTSCPNLITKDSIHLSSWCVPNYPSYNRPNLTITFWPILVFGAICVTSSDSLPRKKFNRACPGCDSFDPSQERTNALQW